MLTNYEPFVDRMIQRYEGGYGWNKADPGGPTKYGITCYDLAEHRGQKMTSMSVWAPLVKAMTLDEAETIYAKKYAAKVRFNDLGHGKDCVLFDYAVNSGYARAIRVARAIVNKPGPLVFDDELVKAVNAVPAQSFINAVCDERLHFMHGIRGGSAWEEFGVGWGRRVADLRAYSLALATSAATGREIPKPVAPDLSKVATPKASHTDPNLATKTVTGTVTTGTMSGGSGGLVGVPLWIVAAGVTAVVIGGVVYFVLQRRAATRANETVVLPPNVQPLAA